MKNKKVKKYLYGVLLIVIVSIIVGGILKIFYSKSHNINNLTNKKEYAATKKVNDDVEFDGKFYDCVIKKYNNDHGTQYTHGDNLTAEELREITTLDCSDKDITSIKGIEALTKLESLNISGNQLESIKNVENSTLKTLLAYDNKLTELDVSGFINLQVLSVTKNKLTSINVSSNKELLGLAVADNDLTELNVTENTKLLGLSVNGNKLTSLDLSNNKALEELYMEGNKFEKDLYLYNSDSIDLAKEDLIKFPSNLVAFFKEAKSLGNINVDEEEGIVRVGDPRLTKIKATYGLGIDVNNYVCFGTSNKDECISEEKDENNLTGQQKYMYRILGIEKVEIDNEEEPQWRLKLIKEKSISGNHQWNNDNEDKSWKFSSLKEALNGEKFLENETYVPTGWEDAIENIRWKYGDINVEEANKSADEVYSKEKEWTNTTEAKIGLMKLHDYYYSRQSGGLNCFNDDNMGECKKSWMHISNSQTTNKWEWTMSRVGLNSSTYNAWTVTGDGEVGNLNVQDEGIVRPVFYLTSTVKYKSGTGTYKDPYIIDNVSEDNFYNYIYGKKGSDGLNSDKEGEMYRYQGISNSLESDHDYSGVYNLHVIKLTSSRYDINDEEEIINIKTDADTEKIKSNLNVANGQISVEGNKLVVKAINGHVVKTYTLVNGTETGLVLELPEPYELDDTVIKGIDLETKVDELDLGIDDTYTIKVHHKEKNKYIATGDKIEISKGNQLVGEYTALIKGDINGDGLMTIVDYVKIKKHVMEDEEIDKSLYYAADVNKDNNISMLDYIRIKNHVMENN